MRDPRRLYRGWYLYDTYAVQYLSGVTMNSRDEASLKNMIDRKIFTEEENARLARR